MKTANDTETRELVLYATNDGDLYRQRVLPIVANLARKVKKGTFDATLSVKLWRYLADDAAKKYRSDFRMSGGFDPATREAAAREFAEHYDEAIREAAASL